MNKRYFLKTEESKITRINENLVLGIYFILAIEYDLYNFFGFGNIIAGTPLTFIEIAILLFVILTTKKRNLNHYILYLFLLIGIGWSYVAAPNCRSYLSEFFFEGSSLKKIFVLPLAFQCIKDPEYFSNKFYKLCVIEGYIHVLCNLIWGYGNTEWGAFNYMVYGMALLTPTCFVMQNVFSNPSKLNIITFIIFEITIVVYGHRGALLVTAVMALIFFIKYVNIEKKVIIGILGFILFLIIYLLKNQINEYIIGIIRSLGIESRTLEKIFMGTLTDDSERNLIWGIIGANIIDSFPFGLGIGSDRIILGMAIRKGLYAHNFILELCLDFGIVVGAVIVGVIVFMCYRSLVQIKDLHWARLIQPLLIPSIITLLTSSSIYQYWLFWAALGVYFDYFDRNRKLSIKLKTK